MVLGSVVFGFVFITLMLGLSGSVDRVVVFHLTRGYFFLMWLHLHGFKTSCTILHRIDGDRQ